MKKLLYMSGAVVNAGDFLIEKRALALLHHLIPEASLTIACRVGKDYTDQLEYLNSFDGIIFAGGPIYQISIYPNAIPFVSKSKLGNVTKPLFFIGGGIKSNVYFSKMNKDTFDFFKLGDLHGVPLGCRDVLSYRFLKHQGFDNVMMTGCPAWYCLRDVEKTEINKHANTRMKICVSEPAKVENIPILQRLIISLRNNYSDADIVLIIHRENKKELDLTISKIQEKYDVRSVHIAGSAEGFSNYDDCDMHVGFRVHAHIYNLSVRNISFLINEDIRGEGVNQTLGLESINIEKTIAHEKHLFGDYYISEYENINDIANQTVIHVFDSIENTEKCSCKNYNDAFSKMKQTYEVMKSHINIIGSY